MTVYITRSDSECTPLGECGGQPDCNQDNAAETKVEGCPQRILNWIPDVLGEESFIITINTRRPRVSIDESPTSIMITNNSYAKILLGGSPSVSRRESPAFAHLERLLLLADDEM